jgi:hypothetical protein
MHLEKLSDEEVAYLLFATEHFGDKEMREYDYSPTFQHSAEKIQNALFAEYMCRKLKTSQFYR